MADVDPQLYQWSTNEASNKPTGTTTIGSGLDDCLRQIQATTRAWLATKGADIASASTTDVGAIAGSSHDITGSTTIVGFGTVSAGIWKTLRFTGAPLIKHNATSNILMAGGGDIQAQTGDGCYLGSLGSGNWFMPFFQRANGNSIVSLYAQSTAIASTSTLNLNAIVGDYVHVTGNTTIVSIGLAQGLAKTTVSDATMVLANSTLMPLFTSANITTAPGDVQMWRGEGAGTTRLVGAALLSGLPLAVTYSPPVTREMTATGTYIPTLNMKHAKIMLHGAGGGGGGQGSGTSAGGTGGTTSVGALITAIGGGGGGDGAVNRVGGIGGTGGTGGDFHTAGNGGTSGAVGSSANGGGAGGAGSGPIGGGGGPSGTNPGLPGTRGGGGAGAGAVTSATCGGGGGSGEYAEGWFSAATIGASQLVTIGAGGTAGTGTNAGGAGGSGRCVITEYFQ